MADLLTLPELFLFGTLASVVFSEVVYRGERSRFTMGIAFFGILAAVVQILLSYRWLGQPAPAFMESYGIDGIGAFFKLVASILALGTLGALMQSTEHPSAKKTEALIFILTATLGAYIAASANEILLWILGFALALLSGVFLVGLSKRRVQAIEGGFKLLIYQAIILASLCVGLVLLLFYFPSHSLHLRALRMEFPQELGQVLTPGLGMILIFLGLAVFILLGAFPAFTILPETAVAATMPTGLLVTGLLPMLGVLIGVRLYSWILILPAAQEWRVALAGAAGLTLIFNSLHSAARPGAKRILSWLLTTHSAFALVGISIATPESFAAVFYQLLGHTVAAVGAFHCFASIQRRTGVKSDRLSELVAHVKDARADTIGFFFFAAVLAGLPPFSISIARFSIIQASFGQGWTAFSVFLIGMWVFSAFQFVRLTHPLIRGLSTPTEGESKVSRSPSTLLDTYSRLAILVLGSLLAVWTIFAAEMIEWTQRTFQSFF